MKNKVCFITSLVICNDYLPDKPGKINKMNNCDYKLITNDKSKIKNSDWEIIEVNLNNLSSNKNSVILSRILKFQPWKIKELDDYEILIYCDAYWTPINNYNFWNKVFNDLINDSCGLIQSKNPYRNCAYDECNELVKAKKHSLKSKNETINFLEENNLPKNFGLWRNTFLIYLPKNDNVRKLFNTFWDIYKDNKYTHRDQPLYSLAVFKTNIIPTEVFCKKMDHIFFEMNGERGGVDGKHIYIFD